MSAEAPFIRPFISAFEKGRSVINAAAVAQGDGFFLLPRVVKVPQNLPLPIPLPETGEPDYDQIQVRKYDETGSEVNPAITVSVDAKHKGIVNAEDPRALQISREEVIVGITAVTRENSCYHAHPAYLKAKFINGNLIISGEPNIFLEEKGKSFTPVSASEFLLRRDGIENNHKLALVEPRGQKLVTKKEIQFPQSTFWMEEKVGTTASPLELPDATKLLIVHGVRKEKAGGIFKYAYSLGLSLLDNDWNLLFVDPDPLLTREDFANSGILADNLELHNYREVVYSCGYLIRRDGLPMVDLFVNVGDLMIAQARMELSYFLRRIREKMPYYKL